MSRLPAPASVGTRALVTGGSGFVGSHVVDALVAAGWAVRSLDRVPPPADRANPGAEYLVGDLGRPETVEAALDGVDAVSHQAAMVGLGVDFDDVTGYVADNCLGTAALLRALHRQGFRGRLVLASSMVVYGEGRYRCPEHGPVRPGPRSPEDLDGGRFEPPCPACGARLDPEEVDEDAPPDPRNVYAATKLLQEHLWRSFGREHGVAACALRYHNVYGPRMPEGTPYSGVAAIFASALAAGQAPQVFEDGNQRRDFVHVSDVARANVLALSREPPPAGAFNVASGQPRTVAQLAQGLAAAYGPGAPRPVVTGRWRAGDVRHVVASPRLAARALGFVARVAPEEGLADLARHLGSSAQGRETASS